MSTSGSIDWPLPEAVLEWIGESELSRDGLSNAILGVSATAVEQCYTRWYNFHREIVSKMDVMAIDLQAANKEKKGVPTLKMRITTLEKEVAVLRDESTKYRGQADKWAERYGKLADDYQTLRTTANATPGVQNTIIQKIKPFEPKRYEGSQDLEVVTRYLDEVEHYVRQGASMCPKASSDNQNIDTFWRFLSVKIFRWFEKEMKEREVDTIPPTDSDYKIKWADFKKVFKEQFVPEVAVSVVRNEWRALKFNKNQVLKFNQRALELIEILGGSLSITRGDPLWEEYLRKLPEAAAQDVTQQARLMRRVHKIELTLSDMMDIMAERTLPYLPPTTLSDTPRVASTPIVTTSTADYGDPMDLSNMEDPELYTVDEASKRCFWCLGFGHIAKQCPTPSSSVWPAQFHQRQQNGSHSQRDGSRSQADGSYSRRDEGRQHREGHQQWRREPASQRPPAPRQPMQRSPTSCRQDLSPTQKGLRKAGKLYMAGEDQRVYAVDSHEAGSGAYFDGSWDDEDEWDLAKGPRVVDLGEVSDGEKGEGLGSEEAGKDRQ